MTGTQFPGRTVTGETQVLDKDNFINGRPSPWAGEGGERKEITHLKEQREGVTVERASKANDPHS